MSSPGLIRAAACVACAIACTWPAATAQAHFRSRTMSSVAVTDRTITWRLSLRTEDIAEPIGLAKSAGVQEVRAHAARVIEYVAARIDALDGATPCERERTEVDRDPGAREPSVAVVTTWLCPRTIAAPHLRYDLLFDLDVLHQGFASVVLPDAASSSSAVFRVDAREVTLRRDVPAWRHVLDYARLGVEHIFTGYDHLAFLAGLLLPLALLGGLRSIVLMVTAFTVAHSVTLIAAALGRAVVGPAVVEPLIALSVAWVGVENVARLRLGLAVAARRRWLLAGGFGLVHGLGFASVMTDIGLPPRAATASLLAFNVGVEAGQLAVVALVLPALLAVARRHPAVYRRVVMEGGSAVIAALGLVWFVTRLL